MFPVYFAIPIRSCKTPSEQIKLNYIEHLNNKNMNLLTLACAMH
jgi:hypothetical protein